MEIKITIFRPVEGTEAQAGAFHLAKNFGLHLGTFQSRMEQHFPQ